MDVDDETTQMAYATALAEFADAGGYEIEVVWDTCCTSALGIGYEKAKYRDLTTLSGGEQKRLVLEYLLSGPDQVLLLDEPDNFLDVPGKIWLEARIRCSPSGRKIGNRWAVCLRAASSAVTGVGSPPRAGTRYSGPLASGAKTMTPSAFHAPPRKFGGRADLLGAAARHRQRLELAVGAEADAAAVGRPERQVGAVTTLQPPRAMASSERIQS